MRFLHTADWHVGRQIRGRSRAAEHEAVLAEVAGIAAANEVDAVLVPGDLFDSAAPTPESERIVYRALLDLAATGATVVVLAGNHDNDRRLQAVEPLLELGRVVTRPVFARPDAGGVVTVTSRDGSETALVACLPFLSQRHVVRAADLMGQDADESTQQYAERVRRLLSDLCAPFRSDTVNVVAAHCMVAGARAAGSERVAHTMFEYAITSAAFPAAAHYVALGHLHQTQSIAGPCPIHYSGSPLQLDFGEAGQDKFALLVDASVGAPAAVTPVRLSSGRRLRTLEGTLEQLHAVAGDIDLDDYVRVTVTEPVRAGLADDIRDLIPNAVDITLARPSSDPEHRDLTRVGRSPHDLFAAYLTDAGIDDHRVLTLFDELLEEVGAP